MKRFLWEFEGRRFTSARRRPELFEENRTTRDPFEKTLTSPKRRFRDSWLPEEEEELTPEEKEKKNHKENADFVYEGDSGFDGQGAISPADGGPVDYFLDVTGESLEQLWLTGDGDDVVYHQGAGRIYTLSGNDIVYLTEGLGEGLGQTLDPKQRAYLGLGDDKVFGGKGSQYASGLHGDDYFDLGDGHDIARGGKGADEFVIDLQNTGTDIILDFYSVGDRITVKNGGELAQDGDWILAKSNSYNGPNVALEVYADSLGKEQNFYEIRSADNEVAAIFGIGTVQSNIGKDPIKYSLTASIDSSGIEVITSEKLCYFCGTSKGSLDFV